MSQELEQYLASLERSSKYRVVDVLKSSAHETTELVELTEGGSVRGPFIRKRIATSSGIGQTYMRLYNEQQAGRKIASVPYVFECYVTEDSLTVVMECIQGKTLADWVFELEPSAALAAHVFPRICNAVSEIHECFDPPIIHRDLKPSNVMINQEGVKIIDFGIARTYREDADSDTRHFGTPSYAPPEQFGFGQTDVRSDIYALGMLLYYCLAERTPSFSTLDSRFEDDEIPEPLREVIAKATAFDPAMRYASASELKQAFLAAIDEALVPAGSGAREDAPPIAPPSGSPGGSPGAPPSAPPIAPLSMPPSAPPSAPAKTTRLRIPAPASIAWNVVVFLLWALLIASCIFAAIDPDETNAAYPTLVRVIVYPMLMGAFFTFIAYALLHKRFIRQVIPRLPAASKKVELAICAAGAISSLATAVIIYSVSGSFLGI